MTAVYIDYILVNLALATNARFCLLKSEFGDQAVGPN